MKYKYIVAFFILVTTLIGCGGSSPENSLDDDIQYWYVADKDSYFAIDGLGKVSRFVCSIDGDYVELTRTSANLVDSQLTIIYDYNPQPQNFIISDNSIIAPEISGGRNEIVVAEFEHADGIPKFCVSSAVRITDIRLNEDSSPDDSVYDIYFSYRDLINERQNYALVLTTEELGWWGVSSHATILQDPGEGQGLIQVPTDTFNFTGVEEAYFQLYLSQAGGFIEQIFPTMDEVLLSPYL